jgi:magnesium and cobalt exporter, CNNM family
MTIWLIAVAVVVLVAASAFFSGSETALTAASRARILQLERSGDRRATIVGRLIADREKLIGAILLGNNVVNILASALATSALLTLFGQAGVAYATIVMTFIVLVFGELLPKTLAIGNPDRAARATAPALSVVVAILSPVVAAVQVLIRAILRLIGWNASEGKAILSAADEIRGQVDLLHAEGSVVKAERDRLGGLLDLGELDVSDVMVHRTGMHAVNIAEPNDRIVDNILASPYTRVPMWEGEPENIVGVVHAKDLLRVLKTAGDMSQIDMRSIAKKPWFVPDTTPLTDQLNAFLKRKSHFALVVDEYGEVQGLVTLEDIIEEIVGEIADEHDIEVQGLRPQPDGSVNVDGAVPIRDLNRAMDWDLPDDEATTIAGLVIHEARIIPEPGQAFTFHGFRFKVLRKSRNRITALHITPLATETTTAGG